MVNQNIFPEVAQSQRRWCYHSAVTGVAPKSKPNDLKTSIIIQFPTIDVLNMTTRKLKLAHLEQATSSDYNAPHPSLC